MLRSPNQGKSRLRFVSYQLLKMMTLRSTLGNIFLFKMLQGVKGETTESFLKRQGMRLYSEAKTTDTTSWFSQIIFPI